MIFAANHNHIFYRTSCELILPFNITQWRKRRVAITSSVPQSVIDRAVDQWRIRLRACVNAKGHQFEHLL